MSSRRGCAQSRGAAAFAEEATPLAAATSNALAACLAALIAAWALRRACCAALASSSGAGVSLNDRAKVRGMRTDVKVELLELCVGGSIARCDRCE